MFVVLDFISRKITPSTMRKNAVSSIGSYPDLIPFLHSDVGLIWSTYICRTYTSSVAIIKRDWIPIMNYFSDKIFSWIWKYLPVERINSSDCSCKLSGLLIISISFVEPNLVKYHRFLIFQVLKVVSKCWLKSNLYKKQTFKFLTQTGY